MSRFVQTARSLLAAVFITLCSLNLAWAAVNANTASVDELQTVRGIGPTIAERIVEERAKGPFKSLDDLQSRVKGVGNASVKKMAAAGLTTGSSSTRASRSANPARDTSSRDSTARDTPPSDAAARNNARKPVPTLSGARANDDASAARPADASSTAARADSGRPDSGRPLVQPVPKSTTPGSSAPQSDSGKTPRRPSEAAAETPKLSPKASDQTAAPTAKPGQ